MVDVSAILNALKDVSGQAENEFLALHEPCFKGNEWKYTKDCIDTGWVSSVGAYVDRFEKDFADYVGTKHAIAVVNGTSALHISLLLSRVNAKDEVLCPALTFVASANAISYTGATPHFVDSSTQTLAVCPKKLESYLEEIAELRNDGYCYNKQTGKRIAALVVVHILGHIAEMNALKHVVDRFNIRLVEDAAEALGSYRDGIHAGAFGNIAAFSFNGNKTITTGGGGMIVTDNAEMAAKAKHLTTTARVSNGYYFSHDQVGYNYRMPNINAALGCAQLEKLDEFLAIKRKLAVAYEEAFRHIETVNFIKEPKNCKSNYWLNGLYIEGGLDKVLKATNEANLMTRPLWDLMHTLPMYKSCPRAELTNAEKLSNHIINIPSGVNIHPEARRHA